MKIQIPPKQLAVTAATKGQILAWRNRPRSERTSPTNQIGKKKTLGFKSTNSAPNPTRKTTAAIKNVAKACGVAGKKCPSNWVATQITKKQIAALMLKITIVFLIHALKMAKKQV
ncbi:hypothetical protein [Pseudoduganella sp. R-43]|uniref:hypothetical protein n=1 Tax=Pseudoduganella sp. R-43 TaxID=3404063 RepID=UPI003CEB7B7F